MSKEKWWIEVLVGDRTYIFGYNSREVVLLDVDALLYGVADSWVHIQNTYFRQTDIKMVSYRKAT
jgi:hypothetical protein